MRVRVRIDGLPELFQTGIDPLLDGVDVAVLSRWAANDVQMWFNRTRPDGVHLAKSGNLLFVFRTCDHIGPVQLTAGGPVLSRVADRIFGDALRQSLTAA